MYIYLFCFQISSCNLSTKGLDQVEGLRQELEDVKKQLSEKEKLVAKYQNRIIELRGSIEKDRSSDEQVFVQRNVVSELREFNFDQEQQSHSSVKKELEITQTQLCHMEKEVSQLKKKLKEADCNVKRLRSDLVASEKNARDMRSALTAEVAEKHDQILALRREVAALEDLLRQADMQTHFKDDIIKELRKEVKVARSKETLVEVLGIKERSLSHLEHLTEQLEQKEHTIGCLKNQLQQYREAPNALYRIRQQVDWFTENISQQCASGNVPEEFKKCITTMLEELRESIECCNLVPSSTGPCKESIELVKVAQKKFDRSQKDLSQSWASIWDSVHEIDSLDLSQQVEHWKKCLVRRQCLQQKICEIIQSITQIISSATTQTGTILNSVNSLHSTLCSLVEEMNHHHGQQRDISAWLKKLNHLVSKSLVKTEEICQIAVNSKSEEKKIKNELMTKVQRLDALELQLLEVTDSEHKAYEQFCKMEKTQRVKVDTLLATVLHHQEMWTHQIALSDDMKTRILHLIDCLKQVNKPRKSRAEIPVERSLNVKSIVTRISSEIRISISDIEHKQNQISHLETDLSKVRVVLETVQQEIDDMIKETNSKDLSKKVPCLLKKLKKQITNTLTKAGSLVSVYQAAKKEYAGTAQQVVQLQREFDSLEEEVHSSYYYICQEYSKPSSPTCERRTSNSKAELDKYKKQVKEINEMLDSYFQQHHIVKCPGTNERPNQETKLQLEYEEMQKALTEKEEALRMVKDNLQELKCNIKDRDRLAANHEETISVLQNSLKMSQNEAEELHTKITSLEMKNTDAEKDCKRQIQSYQNKISDLQRCLKQSEDATLQLKGSVTALCKLMFAELKAQYIQSMEEKKHQKAEAALQIVISNLKENIHKEQKNFSELTIANKKLQEQLTSSLNAYKKEIEDNNQRTNASKEENMNRINELEEQVKCWSAKVPELERKLQDLQKKFSESARHEKQLQQELLTLEKQCNEEVCSKQREVSHLSSLVKSMTEKLKDVTTELEIERKKCFESEQKLQAACLAYDELKIKAKDKETTAEKLHVALTQLSNKFVSRRLDTKGCVRHYQEECAKFEALYNTTACKLHSKEVEMSSMIQEIDRMRTEIDRLTLPPLLQKEEDTCPFLLERVQQLSKEIQVAHSCQNSYETKIKELTEKCHQKEEEISCLKSQIKQVIMQRDTLLSDLERAQEEIAKLKVTKCSLQDTIKKIEQNKGHLTEQVKSMQKIICEGQSPDSVKLQPNIELQREISSALSCQLRSVKQKLHATRHNYKQLQIAYDELEKRYNLTQKGEHYLDQVRKDKVHCAPCTSKSSKSATYLKNTEDIGDRDHYLEFSSHTRNPGTNWHRAENLNRRRKYGRRNSKEL
ncbi:cingulin-like isoform X3 [Homalodisca vitripennis]|uniref:cingulin-like isoform X3 n=1 Tax=Homalodisca vitripennis TaxID=197043 RepID=UPI001EE9B55A|nr:cingulin-like isoform X3 [Homalodisca vitripennis]